MKRVILCGMMVIAGMVSADAQTTKKGSAKKATAAEISAAEKTPFTMNPAVVLSSEGSYSDRSGMGLADSTFALQGLFIADPVINALNAKARGELSIPSLEIVGLHKNTYGFAHGRLRLTPSGSTSSGGSTGLGGVATGNSMGAIGTSPVMPGVNGKSPDAGSAMWGNARNLAIRQDSVRRQ